MGRIEVVLDDDLERQLRLKAVGEFGGRKGALVAAVSTAVKRYVESDVMESLAKAIKDPTASRRVRENAAAALKNRGDAGLPILANLAADPSLDRPTRELASLAAAGRDPVILPARRRTARPRLTDPDYDDPHVRYIGPP